MAPYPSVAWRKLALALIALAAFATTLGLAAWDLAANPSTGTAELMSRQGGRPVQAPSFGFYRALGQLILAILLILAAFWAAPAFHQGHPTQMTRHFSLFISHSAQYLCMTEPPRLSAPPASTC